MCDDRCRPASAPNFILATCLQVGFSVETTQAERRSLLQVTLLSICTTLFWHITPCRLRACDCMCTQVASVSGSSDIPEPLCLLPTPTTSSVTSSHRDRGAHLGRSGAAQSPTPQVISRRTACVQHWTA